MESKKISFGFLKRRPAGAGAGTGAGAGLGESDTRQYIDCVEENDIKVIGGEPVEEKKPLVIPMKPNTLMTAERLQQIAQEVETAIEETDAEEQLDEKPASEVPLNETLEQMAARELLEDAKNIKTVETQVLTVPLAKQPALMGEKEATLDDYENVPIGDFGMAMLRGMGWTQGKASKYTQPKLRPKGLGLGADKLIKQSDKKKGSKEDGTELMLHKGACVKVIAGKHSGSYGKVVSMDEDSGRLLVDLAVKRESISLSEMMLTIVTKQEYDKQSRVINSEKYEEYIKNEKTSQSKKSSSSEQSTSRQSESSKRNTNGKHREIEHSRSKQTNSGRNSRRNSSSGEERRTDTSKNRNCSSVERDYRRKYLSDEENRGKNRNNDRRRESPEKRKISKSRKERSVSSSSDERKTRRKDRNRRDSSEGDRKLKRRDSSSDDDRNRRKHKSRPRKESADSIQSLDSLSDSPKRSKKKKKERDGTPVGIDKKRKGKKKRRDRDRSPHSRKHKR